MDYIDSLTYLRGLEKLGIRFRIENTRELLDYLGVDYKGEVIHVGGTNGKGSCAITINSILHEAGFNVGLYTSPELVEFTERIQVNNRQIPKDEFAKIVTDLKPAIDALENKPTFFEASTALTLKYFADSKVDVMVLEVGMGGRFDSTNALPSKLAAITNVELDHIQYLGSNIEEIAGEKAGIVHEGSTLITAAEGKALKVMENECKLKKANIVRVGSEVTVSEVSTSLDGTSFRIKSKKGSYLLHTPMRGAFQSKNIACAVAAAEILDVPYKHIVCGVSKANIAGRLDVVQEKPLIILDCAHNPSGLKQTLDFILENLDYSRLIVVAGFSRDKDYKSMINLLSGCDVFIACEYGSERSLKKEKILEYVSGEAAGSVTSAVKHALSIAKDDDLILVTGSIYVVAEAMRLRDTVTL